MVYPLRQFEYSGMDKDMAYILGVYFSDGSVSGNWEKNTSLCYMLTTINESFIDKVKSSLNSLLGYMPKVRLSKSHKNKYGKLKKVFMLRLYHTGFCRWLVDITKHKTVIPEIIKDTSKEFVKEFLGGYFDGDGKLYKNAKGYSGAIVGSVCDWIHDMRDLFLKIDVKTSKVRQDCITSTGKISRKISLNVRDLCKVDFPLYIDYKKAHLDKVKSIILRDYMSNTGNSEDIVRASQKCEELHRNDVAVATK